MPATRILLGVIGRPHGVRGLLRVHSHTAEPADLARYAPLVDDRGRRWTLTWRGACEDGGIAELRDAAGQPLADRSAAEALVNTCLYAERAQLPPTGDDEWYLADLIGLKVVDAAGAPIGRVALVHDYGAGTSLEIERSAAPPLLVPFTRAAVPAVDVAAGRVVVVPPAVTDAGAPPAAEREEDAA
ncbi:MAG TPA: ribosome maturation factor RimM [Acetobacteraceae bacterium]|nr:ribosome maturation factor RimM [Acetobacteraceae bacterium]